MEHDKLGTSEAGMGEKRVSSNADVNAYVFKPVESGKASNVPMQPRKDLCPERETMFQVTNMGYVSLIESRDAYEGRELRVEIDVDDVNWEFEELADNIDGVEDTEDLEDVEDACSLEIEGN